MKLQQIVLICLLIGTFGLLIAAMLIVYHSPGGSGYYYSPDEQTGTITALAASYVAIDTQIAQTLGASRLSSTVTAIP
jgi:hypothetical protein